MKKHLALCIVLLFSVSGLWAQTDSLNIIQESINKEITLDASWSPAIPMGQMTDEVRTTSGRGVQFGISQNVNNRLSFGGNLVWQMFYEKSYEIYTDENSVFSGWQRNYINAFSLMANTKYYFSNSVNNIKAYLSLEIGASIIENYQVIGLYEFKELEWHFAIAPVVGIDIPATKYLGFQVYIKYPNSFKSNSSFHYSWINTGIGIYVKIPE
jgi:hypothetical protein